MQPKEGYTLLYFVKSKNDTKCKNFVNLLCSYVNTLILLYFLRFQEGGATAPLNPPLSTKGQSMMVLQHMYTLYCGINLGEDVYDNVNHSVLK